MGQTLHKTLQHKEQPKTSVYAEICGWNVFLENEKANTGMEIPMSA